MFTRTPGIGETVNGLATILESLSYSDRIKAIIVLIVLMFTAVGAATYCVIASVHSRVKIAELAARKADTELAALRLKTTTKDA